MPTTIVIRNNPWIGTILQPPSTKKRWYSHRFFHNKVIRAHWLYSLRAGMWRIGSALMYIDRCGSVGNEMLIAQSRYDEE